MQDKTFLESLISRNNISMEMKSVHTNPILGGGSRCEELEHYVCRLSKPGKELDVYFSVHGAEDALTLADLLFMLAMDASGCKLLEGLAEHKEEWTHVFGGSDGNLNEIEEFWHEYTGRCRQAEELRWFLGESLYGELLQHFEMSDPLTEHFHDLQMEMVS